MCGVIAFLLLIGFMLFIAVALMGWKTVVGIPTGLITAILVVAVIAAGIEKLRMRNPEYRKRKKQEELKRKKEEVKRTWEETKKKEEERKRQYARIIAQFGKLVTYDEYLAGMTCIGLSPYCRGKKSRGAVVCKNCYLAQGFDRPIGFAQSGGGATKDELGQMVVARLGYHKVGPGQWRWD